jgi:hypothetical protein
MVLDPFWMKFLFYEIELLPTSIAKCPMQDWLKQLQLSLLFDVITICFLA